MPGVRVLFELLGFLLRADAFEGRSPSPDQPLFSELPPTWTLFARIFSLRFFCGAALLPAQTARPERQVIGNVITSKHDPAVRIQLPRSVHYAGGDRWVLYGIADCELHAFVETAGKNVQRLAITS